MVVKKLNSSIDCSPEILLLGADHAADSVLPLVQFRKDASQRFHDWRDELFEETGGEAEFLSVEDASAEDAADDVVATVIARKNAVGDGACDAARMVGEDAECDIGVFLFAESLALGRDGALV